MDEGDLLASQVLVAVERYLESRYPGPFGWRELEELRSCARLLMMGGASDACEAALSRLIFAVSATPRIKVSDPLVTLLLDRAAARARLGRLSEGEADLAAATARRGDFVTSLWSPVAPNSAVGRSGDDGDFMRAQGQVDACRRGDMRPLRVRLSRLREAVDQSGALRAESRRFEWPHKGDGVGRAADDITRCLWRLLESPDEFEPLCLLSPGGHAVVAMIGPGVVQDLGRPWRTNGHDGVPSFELLACEDEHVPVAEPCWRDRPTEVLSHGWSPWALRRGWMNRLFPKVINVAEVDQAITDAFAAIGVNRTQVRPVWRWERQDWESRQPVRVVFDHDDRDAIRQVMAQHRFAGPICPEMVKPAGGAYPGRRDLVRTLPGFRDERRAFIQETLTTVINDPITYRSVVFSPRGDDWCAVLFAPAMTDVSRDVSIHAEVVGVQNLPALDRGALWIRGWGDDVIQGEQCPSWGRQFPPGCDPYEMAIEAEWVFAHIWRIAGNALQARTLEGNLGDRS